MKLFKLLNSLQKRDINRFKQYLASPLFNKRVDIQELLQSWIEENGRHHPKEVYWEKVYPLQEYSTTKWNLLTSRLFKLLEGFLIWNEFNQDEFQQNYTLSKVYRKLNHDKLFKKSILDSGVILEKQVLRDSNYLLRKHNLSFEKYDYFTSQNRKEKTNLQDVSNHLDTYFLTTKLRQACYALSREIIQQEQYEIKLIQEVILFIEANTDYLKIPSIAIYYYCNKSIRTNENELYFVRLREAIKNYQHLFPPTEIRDIYTVAINYSIRKLNTGSSLFVKEAYELYLLSLEQGFLLEEGMMLESTYSNLVFLSVKLKKYKWTKQFIDKYQRHLKPAYRQPLYHFSLSKLYYEQDQLDQSLKHLIQIETKASFLLLGAKVMQLKIYYELEEFDLLESLLETLRVYLQRSKDLGYRKKYYEHILYFTKKLLQVPIMSKSDRSQLKESIQTAEIFTEKEWFLKQIH